MGLVVFPWDEPPLGHRAGLGPCLPGGGSQLGAPVLWALQDVRPALLLLLPKVFFPC